MHNHLARYRPRPLTTDECAIQDAEELTVALEELDALKESLDTSYRAYQRTPTLFAGMALVAALQQTLVAVRAVGMRRGASSGQVDDPHHRP